ncbi:hypothetical protein LCGC14_0430640 [marine sediment metagenome]|uniref:LexA repressor DNA-binding domain-containing protein n=1 Tax=marine sediment metagenome TaxID=412755 RepID=A0A0F9VAB3_9ZZZZ
MANTEQISLMAANKYTPKQIKVMLFVKRFVENNEYSPTYNEIANYMNTKVASAWGHVNELVKKGAIEKAMGKYSSESRGIRLKDSEFAPDMSVVGRVQREIGGGDERFKDFILEAADGIRTSRAEVNPGSSGNSDN